ncbi:hypothetical protein hmeg3_23830 [Herbaspirillum sp. meg3]|uniref:hypothetical protein n=1 Tax=Herbaspirillum sp. meg3 TaxID=2025949 RepID=UPI000B991ADA|nr:hypothetical protein [Herbaspirillum sp. meg3]ASU41031.1 hypothetical protein hmeg3_23830 [Herbaspirillum sp. meg3]
MSIQIALQTNADSTATTKVTGDKKASSNSAAGQSTFATVAAQAAKVTLSSQGIELAKSAASEGVELPKSVEGTITKQKSVGVLPPPDVAAFEADATLPRGELYAKYEKAVASLTFRSQAALDRANAEVPKSDDPARLAQAKQATAYALSKGPSPFTALSRNELAAIYYDYSGRYTSNERIAAAGQMNEMDKQFWGPLVSMASATGDQRAVLEAGLAAYDAALPIEQMKSPANYKQLMQQELTSANNKQKGPIDEKKKETLLEMLNALYQKRDQTKSTGNALEEDQTKNWSEKLAEQASAQ